MTRIADIKDLKTEQVNSLIALGISTDDDLWAKVGGDFKPFTSLEDLRSAVKETFLPGLERISDTTKIPQEDLVRVLSARSVALADAKVGNELQRNWLKLVSLAVGLGVFVLFLRALGLAEAFPEPVGLGSTVLVAGHDLIAGERLGIGDVHTALLPPSEEYFSGKDNLDGMIMAQGLQSQKPLRHVDVMRPQVVAKRDLPVGELIARDAISLTWAAFEPNAETQLTDVVGHRTKAATPAGRAVLSTTIDKNPTWLQAVNVHAPVAGLTYELLSSSDLQLKESTDPPANVNQFLTKDDLIGRFVLAIAVDPSGIEAAPMIPSRVDLLFVPKSSTGLGQDKVSGPLMVRDAILLTVLRPPLGGAAAVLSLTPDDLKLVLPAATTSNLRILKPIS